MSLRGNLSEGEISLSSSDDESAASTPHAAKVVVGMPAAYIRNLEDDPDVRRFDKLRNLRGKVPGNRIPPGPASTKTARLAKAQVADLRLLLNRKRGGNGRNLQSAAEEDDCTGVQVEQYDDERDGLLRDERETFQVEIRSQMQPDLRDVYHESRLVARRRQAEQAERSQRHQEEGHCDVTSSAPAHRRDSFSSTSSIEVLDFVKPPPPVVTLSSDQSDSECSTHLADEESATEDDSQDNGEDGSEDETVDADVSDDEAAASTFPFSCTCSDVDVAAEANSRKDTVELIELSDDEDSPPGSGSPEKSAPGHSKEDLAERAPSPSPPKENGAVAEPPSPEDSKDKIPPGDLDEESKSASAGDPKEDDASASLSTGDPKKDDETYPLSPGDPMEDVETAAAPPSDPMEDVETAATPPGDSMEDVETAATPPGDPMEGVETAATPPGDSMEDVETGIPSQGDSEDSVNPADTPSSPVTSQEETLGWSTGVTEAGDSSVATTSPPDASMTATPAVEAASCATMVDMTVETASPGTPLMASTPASRFNFPTGSTETTSVSSFWRPWCSPPSNGTLASSDKDKTLTEDSATMPPPMQELPADATHESPGNEKVKKKKKKNLPKKTLPKKSVPKESLPKKSKDDKKILKKKTLKKEKLATRPLKMEPSSPKGSLIPALNMKFDAITNLKRERLDLEMVENEKKTSQKRTVAPDAPGPSSGSKRRRSNSAGMPLLRMKFPKTTPGVSQLGGPRPVLLKTPPRSPSPQTTPAPRRFLLETPTGGRHTLLQTPFMSKTPSPGRSVRSMSTPSPAKSSGRGNGRRGSPAAFSSRPARTSSRHSADSSRGPGEWISPWEPVSNPPSVSVQSVPLSQLFTWGGGLLQPTVPNPGGNPNPTFGSHAFDLNHLQNFRARASAPQNSIGLYPNPFSRPS